MAHIGNAYLDVVPKFPGLESSVKKAMASIDTSSVGTQMGTTMGGSFRGGFVKSGAIAGVVSSMASQVTSQIGAHMTSAMARFDILNNYPKVMTSLGYTSKQATESINTMSDRLQVLPTRLDAMVSTVQGFTAITGDIDKATQLGLALNDALLAGGAGAQVASAATEQFRQILAKGKPEMQDWRSLTTAAPGQIDMLAKSLLGASASANDLYMAIGGGDQKHYDGPKIAMDEFIDKIIELDTVGADGLASFQQQAEDATGGIQTQLENLSNAWTRGLADTFDVFGTDRVAAIIADVKGGIKAGFSGFNDALYESLPALDSIYSTVKESVGEIAPLAGDLVQSFAPVGAAIVDNFAPAMESVVDVVKTVAGDLKGAIDTVAPYLSGLIETWAPYAGQIATFAGSFALLKGAGTKFADFCGKVKGGVDKVQGLGSAFKTGWANAIATEADEAVEAAKGLNPIVDVVQETVTTFDQVPGALLPAATAFGYLPGEVEKTKEVFGYLPGVVEPASVALTDFTVSAVDAQEKTKAANPIVSGLKGAFDKVKTGVSGLMGGLSAFVGAGGLPLLISGVSVAASLIVTAVTNARERAENFADATQGIKDAAADAMGLQNFSGAIDKIGESAQLSVMDLDDLTEAISDSKESIERRTQSAKDDITELERARQTISDFAGQTELSTQQTGELKWAIDKVNESLGTNLTMEDVKSDRWVNEQGEVESLKTKIDELIEKKKEEARTAALTDNLDELYKNQEEAAKTYGDKVADLRKKEQDLDNYRKENAGKHRTKREQEEYDAAIKGHELAIEKAQEEVNAAGEVMDANKQAIDNTLQGLSDFEEGAKEGADAWDKFKASLQLDNVGVTSTLQSLTNKITGGTISNDEFTETLKAMGTDVEKFSSLSQKEMIDVASSYDGTAQSLVDALAKYGVATDETMVKNALLTDTFKLMGQDVVSAVESGGGSLSDFAAKLQEAGVSTEQLNQIGSENMAALAQAFGGNLDQMVWAIQYYNNVPIINKDGSVTVNDSELIDAQGNVWTWNGTEFVDKDGNVAVEDQELIDAQGRVWTWNGTEMKLLRAQVNSYGQSELGTLLSQAQSFNNLPGNMTKTAKYTVVNETTNVIKTIADKAWADAKSVGGGSAEGGIVWHANGAIVNNPGSGVSLYQLQDHRAGEAGAEAIVPLTNKRYATPFADLIAELVAGRQDTGTQYNLYIDGASLAADKAASAAMEDLARVLMRRARTTRR